MKCITKVAIGDIPAGTSVMIVTLPKDEKLNVVFKGVVREIPLEAVEMPCREEVPLVVAEKKQRTTRENVIQEIIGDNESVDYALFMQAAQGYLNLKRGEKGWKRKLRKMGYQVVDGKIRKKPADTSG